MTADTSIISKLVRTIREHHLFQLNDTLVVALSGGADSAALLDMLSRLPGFNLQLVAAHLNHCLRGAESDADQEFCNKLAASYGIPFEVRRVDVKELAKSEGLNLEDAGRRARINFLEQVREKHGATAIITAHHCDDQAETILMRLLRGSGMTGLCGIPYSNQRGYIRPLLNVTRAEIELYLTEHGLDWREDASNQDTSFLRNRIRHELLPLLEQYNPSVRRSLISTAAILTDEDALLEALAEQAFNASWYKIGGYFACSIQKLKTQPAALQRRILRHVCRQLAGNLDGFNLGHIESIRRLPDSSGPNSRLSLPQSVSAVREYDRIILCLSTADSSGEVKDIHITEPGRYQMPGGGSLEVTISSAAPVDYNCLNTDSACFDLEITPLPWLVRSYRPGDRITPIGMTGRKKVKDIFIDNKIPMSERKMIPLLFCEGELMWIAGLRRADKGRIWDGTTSVLNVTYKNSQVFVDSI